MTQQCVSVDMSFLNNNGACWGKRDIRVLIGWLLQNCSMPSDLLLNICVFCLIMCSYSRFVAICMFIYWSTMFFNVGSAFIDLKGSDWPIQMPRHGLTDQTTHKLIAFIFSKLTYRMKIKHLDPQLVMWCNLNRKSKWEEKNIRYQSNEIKQMHLFSSFYLDQTKSKKNLSK